MTKADIVTDISNKTGISKEDVLAIVEGFMTTVKNSISLLRSVLRSLEETSWLRQV